MTEHMPHLEPISGKERTVRKHVTINGLPTGTAFSDATRNESFYVDVHEPVVSGDVNLEGSSTEAFPGLTIPSTFDVNQRAGKAGLSAEKATIMGGQPVEEDTGFPGVQRQESTPITTRAEARQRKGRHVHETKHAAPTERTLFTPEQLQGARDRLANVLGRIAIIKGDLLDTRILSNGDHGDNEIYIGRHRPGHTLERSNRVKRGAYRLATILDNKLHDYREGHVPDYDEMDVDSSEGESASEPEVSGKYWEGREVMLGGKKWTVEIVDGNEVTLQRLDEASNEVEIESISLSELNDLTGEWEVPKVGEAQPAEEQLDDDEETEQEYRSKLQQIRELPLLLAAKMAAHRHIRQEVRQTRWDALTEEQKDDRRRYRKLALLGGAVVGTIVAIKLGHDHIWTAADDIRNSGIKPPVHHVPGGGNSTHHASEFLQGSKGSTHFNHEGVVDASSWLNGHKIANGESAWSLAEQYATKKLNIHNPSVYQIDAIKDQLVPLLKKAGVANRSGKLISGDIIKLK